MASVPKPFLPALLARGCDVALEPLHLDLALGRVRFAGQGGCPALCLTSQDPGLLLVPLAGRFLAGPPDEPARAINAQVWYWAGVDRPFSLRLPPEGALLWFQVPAGLPGFCPLFSLRNRQVGAAASILPLLDLLDARRLGPELRRAALFGRSLDLLAHAFQFQPGPGGDDGSRIDEARRILLERLAEPPTIPQLAGLVGLNECKLKARFKATFGFTLHGFVKEQRLRRALDLLHSGDMRVSEVAWEVGWENCGHFAQAFRDRFGCCPSRLEAGAAVPARFSLPAVP